LILYGRDTDKKRLTEEADKLRAEGLRVRLEREKPEDIRCGKVCRMTENGLREEAGENA
jgi:hypothetical protein